MNTIATAVPKQTKKAGKPSVRPPQGPIYDIPDLDTYCQVDTRAAAESIVCAVFARAGVVLGVTNEAGQLQSSVILSPKMNEFLQDCRFRDPNFIGGAGAVRQARTSQEFTQVFSRARYAADEISQAFGQSRIDEAEFLTSVLLRMEAWLRKKRD